jgi:hypothetical protein
MNEVDSPASFSRSTAAGAAGLAILLMAITVGLQWSGHAYSSNFGAEEPDEPAHYVTGLMVHDYVANGFPGYPLEFAKSYYLHYPKVALGAWPPFFYLVEASWMLAFSPFRPSVLLLSGVITVSSASILLLVVRRQFGIILAFLAGAAYVLLPTVQASTASVMIDGLVALLELLAALLLARYVDFHESKYAYAFGFVAALAALTKANALALVLLPGIVIVLTGRWRLLRRREIWLALLMIVAAAAPWNYFLLRLASHSVSLIRSDPLFALDRGGTYLKMLAQVTGLFLPFTAAGVWMTIVRPFRRKLISGLWASIFALIAAGFLFHAAVPANVIEPRYLLPCLAPMLLFATAGLHWMAQAAPFRTLESRGRTLTVAAVLAIAFFALQFRIARRTQPNFDRTAERLAHEPAVRAILVSANSSGEGMAVSEIAMHDARPRHYILRSTKVLSASDWNGEGYNSRFATPQQVSDYLESVPVDYVLASVAASDNRLLHHRLLLDALRSRPERWRTEPYDGGLFSVWERVHPIAHGKPKFSVDMNYTFNSSLSTAGGSSR